MKGLVIRNTHVKYKSPTSYGTKVMANVKVFVHATDANTDADTDADADADAEANTGAMTLAPRTYVLAR